MDTDTTTPPVTKSESRTPLEFTSDRGASRPFWIALGLLVAIVGWMASGFVVPQDTDDVSAAGQPEPVAKPVAVSVRHTVAAPVQLYFQAEGQAQPDRDTQIRAEMSGDVAEILALPGQDVARGDVIAKLTSAQAEADLRRASEDRENAARELENAQALLQRGVATEDRVVSARAALASADAAVTLAQEAFARTTIVAPFDGRIEALTLDVGEYISTGSEIGRIVDITPLTVSLQVPQQSLSLIKVGQTADVAFITGEDRQGRVTFVGTSAASETRTFLTEIQVPNDDGAVPAGISAEIRIPTGQENAHFISPSVVSLNTAGVPGVKTVEDGRVRFYEVTVVRTEVDGLWVTGLPDEVDLITIGQGFVREGEQVDPRAEIAPTTSGASE